MRRLAARFEAPEHRPASMRTIWISTLIAVAVLTISASGAADDRPSTPPAAKQDDAALFAELQELVRTLHAERRAYYERQRERAPRIEAARKATEELEAEVAELRLQEAEIDTELSALRAENDALLASSESAERERDALTANLERAEAGGTRHVEAGIPYRGVERRRRLSPSAADGGDESTTIAARLLRYWLFARRELDIARTAETFTDEVALDDDVVIHARLFRVGGLVLGYSEERGVRSGLWSLAQTRWRHDLSEAERAAVERSIAILERREAPDLVSLPVDWITASERAPTEGGHDGERSGNDDDRDADSDGGSDATPKR